ncbi:hypothetical protein BSKO_01300 [Bryopsis sp. KO-2023]|nr:hypothetical protein BSKO_01300 [Bryopsis sp. KO-2023]
MFWACGLPLRKSNSSPRSAAHSKSMMEMTNTHESSEDPLDLEGFSVLNTERTEKYDQGYRSATTGSSSQNEDPPSSSTALLLSTEAANCIPKLDPRTIHFGKTLGRGAFSTVYKATLDGAVVALKVIQHTEGSIDTEPLEAYLGKHIAHPNIVKVLGVHRHYCGEQVDSDDTASVDSFDSIRQETPQATTPQLMSAMSCASSSSDIFSDITNPATTTNTGEACETWIAMELCDKGSLRQAISAGEFFEDRAKCRPRVLLILLTALEIAIAMSHLHAAGIIHGDLKPQNVMLVSSDIVAKDFVCKVGDFGLSRLMNMETHISTFSCGSVSHMPPEVLRDGILTPAADVFSFGVLLWELMSGKLPFVGQAFTDMMVSIVEGYRPKMPQFFPTQYAKLIRECWSSSRQVRPTFDDIVERLRVMIGGPCDFSRKPVSTPRASGIPRAPNGRASNPAPSVRTKGPPGPGESILFQDCPEDTARGQFGNRIFSFSRLRESRASRASPRSGLHTTPVDASPVTRDLEVRRRSFSGWPSREVKSRKPSQDITNDRPSWRKFGLGGFPSSREKKNISFANPPKEDLPPETTSPIITPLNDRRKGMDKPPTTLSCQFRLDG